ncbi:basement membrane-specific heparan sulfate proteoglycan core protein-like [Gouania willdenowi]|uniref:basement membrane-specific heparan sulfate proteoglycan core protein-like n=1 Tax=Gouania willdenowi TaxID=441366 RepID=UPI001056D076|nr:basement membrane-specific heparan sulfate proteoglycan core protein-like [Gouania willdenowi]
MELGALCAVAAILKVCPSRSQFFTYEQFSLSCEGGGGAGRSDWTVKRNTLMYRDEVCGSNCSISDLYPMDSGEYWCESSEGRCRSSSINISITDGTVALDSPVVPVMEGEDVTLSCRQKTSSSSFFFFYRDHVLIGNSSSSNFTIFDISKADEGLYRCEVPGAGSSLLSLLSVSEQSASTPPPPTPSPSPPPPPRLVHFLFPVVISALVVLTLLLFVRRRRIREVQRERSIVSYTDVTPRTHNKALRHTGLESGTTFYSSLNLNSI